VHSPFLEPYAGIPPESPGPGRLRDCPAPVTLREHIVTMNCPLAPPDARTAAQ